MHQSPARSTLAASLAALLLAGCGGGGGGGSAAPSSQFGPSSAYAGDCTLEGQKLFARSYLDEVYFWYDEVVQVDPARFDNVRDYFNALLVRTRDANGVFKDRFSTVLPLEQAPAQAIHTDAVPRTRVLASAGGRRTGYIRFDDHEAGAQEDLVTAFRSLRDAAVQDLVLDMRVNTGGFLYVAQAAASMVAGPDSEGKVFEKLQYNDKRQALSDASVFPFSSRLQVGGRQYPAGTALPQLGLPRLYVLASGLTCSSSESIVNGLRGIDVEVVLVGATTCGKPYGFSQKNNCGHAYFPIEFKGANAKGYGDYTAGLAPTCAVTDDPDADAGSTEDPLMQAALFHIDEGRCPAPAAALRAEAGLHVLTTRPGRPPWAGRLLAETAR